MKKLQRRFRLLIWFIRAYLQKHKLFLFFGFLAGLGLFLGVIKLASTLSLPIELKKTKKIAVVGSFTPSALPSNILNLISLGLTTLNPAGEASPSLAKRWDIRDNGKTYIFHLKDHVFWQDGTEFKAADVNYNLKDVKIEAIDDQTLKVNLKDTFSPLPSLFSRPIFKRGLVGLGLYKINRLILKGDRVEFISLLSVADNLPSLEFKFYPSEETAITAFKLGEVNTLEKIEDIQEFAKSKNITKTRSIFFNFNIVVFYNTRLPLLQSKTNRQALSYAIPNLNEEKSYGPINPASWAYFPKVKEYSYDFELAKQLFEKPATPSSITISTFPSFLKIAQTIAQSWSKLDLKVNVKVENSLPANFDILLVSQEIPADPDQYHLWHSTQETNISGLANPRIDKLLEDGRKTLEKKTRLEIYQDFQKYLLEEAPATFLYHPTLYTIERI